MKTELASNNVFHKYENKDDSVYVLIDAPQIREISYEIDDRDKLGLNKIKGHCKLNLPYICYVVKFYKKKFSKLKVFTSTRKIKSIDQSSLDTFDFLNCSEESVCLGQKAIKFLKKKSINDVLRLVPRIFWETPFNDAYAELDETFSERLSSGKLNKSQIVNMEYSGDVIRDVSISEIIENLVDTDSEY